MKKNYCTALALFILHVHNLTGQDTNTASPMPLTSQDSMVNYLVRNRIAVESLVGTYNSFRFHWLESSMSLALLIGFVVLIWNLWLKEKLAKDIQEKAQEAVEKLTDLKNAHILVLTSETGNDLFLRTFFKAKKFKQVKYLAIKKNTFLPITDFEYDVVFANNDDGNLDQDTARRYYHEGTVFFYFGKEKWDNSKDGPELAHNLNMANSRAQIYGNLISSLEFLELVKPKIKNV